ncbi:MAG: hypothetical protein AABX04_04745 [Nanoarchaeota archaeon]
MKQNLVLVFVKCNWDSRRIGNALNYLRKVTKTSAFNAFPTQSSNKNKAEKKYPPLLELMTL